MNTGGSPCPVACCMMQGEVLHSRLPKRQPGASGREQEQQSCAAQRCAQYGQPSQKPRGWRQGATGTRARRAAFPALHGGGHWFCCPARSATTCGCSSGTASELAQKLHASPYTSCTVWLRPGHRGSQTAYSSCQWLLATAGLQCIERWAQQGSGRVGGSKRNACRRRRLYRKVSWHNAALSWQQHEKRVTCRWCMPTGLHMFLRGFIFTSSHQLLSTLDSFSLGAASRLRHDVRLLKTTHIRCVAGAAPRWHGTPSPGSLNVGFCWLSSRCASLNTFQDPVESFQGEPPTSGGRGGDGALRSRAAGSSAAGHFQRMFIGAR